MVANIMLPLWILLSCITGALAETCYGENDSITCIFGCCEDTLYVYCCLSNRSAIIVICACLAVVLSCIGACCRLAYRNNNVRQIHVEHNDQANSGAVVTTNTTNQGAYGNQPQPMSQFAPPAYPGPPTTPPYPAAPATYPPKY